MLRESCFWISVRPATVRAVLASQRIAVGQDDLIYVADSYNGPGAGVQDTSEKQ